MNTKLDSESWFERRLEAVQERFLRGEIDEVTHQRSVDSLWRTYDNFVEYSPSTMPEAMEGGLKPPESVDGRAA